MTGEFAYSAFLRRVGDTRSAESFVSSVYRHILPLWLRDKIMWRQISSKSISVYDAVTPGLNPAGEGLGSEANMTSKRVCDMSLYYLKFSLL